MKTIFNFRFILGRRWESVTAVVFSLASFVTIVSWAIEWLEPGDLRMLVVGAGIVTGSILGLVATDLVLAVVVALDTPKSLPWEE